MFARLVHFRSKWPLVAVMSAVLAMPLIGHAENITGKVLDPQGSAVPDAQIRLFDRNGGDMRSTTSSKDGAYSFQGIPAGSYLVEADASTGTLRGSQEVTVRSDENWISSWQFPVPRRTCW